VERRSKSLCFSPIIPCGFRTIIPLLYKNSKPIETKPKRTKRKKAIFSFLSIFGIIANKKNLKKKNLSNNKNHFILQAVNNLLEAVLQTKILKLHSLDHKRFTLFFEQATASQRFKLIIYISSLFLNKELNNLIHYKKIKKTILVYN
jgi:hypothetical protein